jgi:hypothetical protein
MRYCFASRLIMGVLSVTLLAAPGVAQVDQNAPADESGTVIEELVIVGTRPGDQDKADPMYEEMLRQQMMEEVQRMRFEEEEDWRNSNLTYQSSQQSRIVWGYDLRRIAKCAMTSSAIACPATRPNPRLCSEHNSKTILLIGGAAIAGSALCALM